MDEVRRLADAVLYEGYLLWPYRRSALKNQRRWTFGGVFPRAHAERHPDDRCAIATEVLLEDAGARTRLEVAVRYLHVVRRQAMRGDTPVDEVEGGGERHLSWDEATEREVVLRDLALAALRRPRRLPVDARAGQAIEDLDDDAALVRSWSGIVATLEVGCTAAGPGTERVRVCVRNTTPWPGGAREDAQRRALCSAHLVLRVRGRGRFVSATDPPARHAAAAAACRQEGLWPVLAGPPGSADTVLAAPLILSDHARIAPESPGDLFDGGEIDQLLTLSILGMTDDEKAEMRATDPRARAILDRTERLSPEQLLRLNGTFRDVRAVRP